MSKKTILLVDDTESLIKLGKAIFESDGYEVLTATDGLEALKVFAEKKVDLLVTDILMPNMDGYMLCYSIRTNSRDKDLPIIIYTATYTSKSDEAFAMEIGADLFLRKPASISTLLSSARILISGPRKEFDIKSLKESPKVMRQYSSTLVGKLEEKNLELEEAKQFLESSEKRFRGLIEKVADMIALVLPEGKLIYGSPSVKKYLGYEPNEFTNLSTFEIVHPDDLFSLTQLTEMIVPYPGNSFICQVRIKHRNGKWIWCEGSVSNMLEEPGIMALVTNFRDITERKKTEEELIATNHRLSFHIENAPLGFIEWDSDLHVKSMSKRAEEIFGWTEKEFREINKTGYSQVYIDDQPGMRRIAEQLISGELDRNNVQHRNYRKDGSVIWCEWFNSVQRNEHGKVITIMSLVQDITDRKNGEENLIKSELRFREFFENAPEAIIVLDLNTLTFCRNNSNAVKLLKYSQEELQKKGPGDISPAFQPDGISSEEKSRDYIERTLQGEKPVFEWLVKDGLGQEIMCEVRMVALANTEGHQLFASFIDITERKAAETALMNHFKTLSDVAFMQSHQVRAPIANLLGLISLFEFDNPSDPINAEILSRVETASKSLDLIIHEIVKKTNEIDKLMTERP